MPKHRPKSKTYKTPAGVFVRSGFEATVLGGLEALKVPYEYEPSALSWIDTSLAYTCSLCGSRETHRLRTYLGDAYVRPKRRPGFWLEVKGLLTLDDRRTILGVKECHPALDLRMVFMRDNKLTKAKGSKRYTAWAESHDIPCAVGAVPEAWVL